MLALVAGVLLGVISRLSDLLAPEVGWIGNLFAPWLAVAFLLGFRAPTKLVAAMTGALALVIAAITHYAVLRLSRDGFDAELLRHPVPMWCLIGGAGGALFGVLGWAAVDGRARVSIVSAALLSAAFFSEAVYLTRVDRTMALKLAVPVAVLGGLLAPVLALDSKKRAVIAVVFGLISAPLGVKAIGVLQRSTGRVYWERGSTSRDGSVPHCAIDLRAERSESRWDCSTS